MKKAAIKSIIKIFFVNFVVLACPAFAQRVIYADNDAPAGRGCGEWMAIDAHSGELVFKTPTCIN